jgi:hypothetical protein
MTNALFSCVTCNKVFRSRSVLTYHVKRDHQSSVKVKFDNGSAAEINKGQNGTFICKCEKRFKLSVTLRKHAKTCSGERGEPENIDMENEDMMEEVSDASGMEDSEERQVSDTSVDCFGALISHEKC